MRQPVTEHSINVGRWAEEVIRGYFYKNARKCNVAHLLQCECLLELTNGTYAFYEIKAFKPFKPPPFEGHGISRKQLNKYIRFQKKKQIAVWLCVVDTESGVVYRQRLSRLEAGPYFDTRGEAGMRVYPLESFEVWFSDVRDMGGRPMPKE